MEKHRNRITNFMTTSFAPESRSGAIGCAPSFVGIDGCRGGWLAVRRRSGASALAIEVSCVRELTDVLGSNATAHSGARPRMTAIDMPIGLLDRPQAGGRPCDTAARSELGGRASSIFSPPSREVLGAKSFEETRGFGLSLQSFHLLPKIRELDEWMTPGRQRTLREAHPELVFRRLAGRSLEHPKRRPEGLRERLAILRADGRFGSPRSRRPDMRYLDRIRAETPRPRGVTFARDDLVDAMVLALAAEDIVAGRAARYPGKPKRDNHGLQMEIWG